MLESVSKLRILVIASVVIVAAIVITLSITLTRGKSENTSSSSENLDVTSREDPDYNSEIFRNLDLGPCNLRTDVYHDTNHLESCLQHLTSKICPNQAKIVKLGTTVLNRDISGVVFNSQSSNSFNKTQIGLFANIHGNEASGRELLVWLMKDLCLYFYYQEKSQTSDASLSQSKDSRTNADSKFNLFNFLHLGISNRPNIDNYIPAHSERYQLYSTLFQTSTIHIIPSLNPDGFEKRILNSVRDNDYNYDSKWLLGRTNQHSLDLNRNFPEISDLIYPSKLVNQPDLSRLFNDTYFEDYFESQLKLLDLNSNNGVYQVNSGNEEAQLYTSNFYRQHSIKLPKTSNSSPEKILQPETLSAMNYFKEVHFDHVINFHDGSKVVSYLMDKNPQGYNNNSPVPDDTLVKKIARSYADAHLNFIPGINLESEALKQLPLSSDYPGCISYEFKNGIINGADWYTLGGSLQDYNYFRYGSLHYTVEVNCQKFVDETELTRLLSDNIPALYSYLEMVNSKIVNVIGNLSDNSHYRVGQNIEFIKRATPNDGQGSVPPSFQTANSIYDRILTKIFESKSENLMYFKKSIESTGVYRMFLKVVFLKMKVCSSERFLWIFVETYRGEIILQNKDPLSRWICTSSKTFCMMSISMKYFTKL